MSFSNILNPAKDEHLGMYKVYERLRLFFGGDVTMRVESEEGCGTGIFLNLPAIRYTEGMQADDLRDSEDKKAEATG